MGRYLKSSSKAPVVIAHCLQQVSNPDGRFSCTSRFFLTHQCPLFLEQGILLLNGSRAQNTKLPNY